MRIYNGKNIDYDARIAQIEAGLQALPPAEPVEFQNSAFDEIVRIVYQPDERTGLPTGDLTYFVSDSVNPEIKQFILNNIMLDTSSAANVPIPKGMDEGLAFDLMRQPNEELNSYRNRLNDYIQMNKHLIESASVQFKSENPSVASSSGV